MKGLSLKYKLLLYISIPILIATCSILYFSFKGVSSVSNDTLSTVSTLQTTLNNVKSSSETSSLNNLKAVHKQIYYEIANFTQSNENLMNFAIQSTISNTLQESDSDKQNNSPVNKKLPKQNRASLNNRLIPYLGNLVKEHRMIKQAFIATPNRAFYISPLPSENLSSFNVTDEKWYKKALISSSSFTWSNMYLDVVSKKPIITLSKPIYHNRTLLGVMGFDVSLSQLSSMTRDVNLGENSYTLLVDNENKIISHSSSNSFLGKKIEDFLPNVSLKKNKLFYFTFKHKPYVGYFTTDKNVDFNVLTIVEKDELFPIENTINESNANALIAKTKVQEKETTIFIQLLFVSTSLILVALYLSFTFTNKLLNRIHEAKNKMALMADGDLTQSIEIKHNDELDTLFLQTNAMITNLRTIIANNVETSKTLDLHSTELSAISEQTTAYSQEIASNIEEIAHSSLSQAHDVSSTLDSVQVFAQSIDKVSQNVIETTQTIQETNQTSIAGSQAVERLQKLSHKSVENTKLLSQNIHSLLDSIHQVSTFNTSIKSIAEQIDLLALNAAIEAARAGEHGKGFNVVADEVRKLSVQTTKSVSQIDALISTILQKVQTSTERLQENERSIQDQHNEVEQTKSSFQEIEYAISHILTHIETVRETMIDMKNTKNSFVDSLENSASTSQMNASNSMKISESSKEQMDAMNEVTQTALKLKEIVEELNIEINKFIY